MTRSHDDIEVVTRLLEEKERDLELTAQIGKELLEQNQLLENRIIILEIELKTSNDNLAQLSHELHQKNELVSILTNDIDDNNSENGTPTAVKSINFELLQKKISILEDENKALRQEASQLAKDSVETEESDRKFMADITSQLYNTNTQYDDLRLELERQKDENLLQHEQIITITTRLMETELRLHQLTTENEEQSSMLCITKENQNLLAVELSDFKGRYQEVVALLSETQEQLRRIKKRNQPTGRICTAVSGGTNSQPLNDCLHFELLETTFSDNSLDSGISMDHRNPAAYKTAFETVRCASKSNLFADTMPHLGAMSMTSSSQPKMSAFATQNSVYKGTSSVFSGSNYQSFDIQPQPSTSMMGLKTFSRESLLSFEPEESYPAQAPCGTPGVPGAKDLEAALNRLTSAEVLARRTMLSHAPLGTYSYEDTQLPLGCRTPDSIMSTGLSTISCLSSQQWRLPEKLQIVKPMEGSQTLSHWSRLATPTLGGLLEERPGVRIRGGRGLDDLGLQIYSLSDVEEDFEDHPGKQFQSSSCVFTFTNSTVLHPDDGTLMFSVPPSQIASQITSQNSSRHSSAPQTPRACLSRRNSCSTFSVSLGLASMLYERGIKAVTPSALNTPCGLNYTPTVTPCNSPEGSPPRSMSPEPQFLTGLLSCGTDLLRRKILGDAEKQHKFRARNKITLTRLERRALRSIKILEKVESIGLNNIITTTSSSQQQSAVSPLGMQGSTNFYSSHSRSASPMAQLTSFKKFGTSEYKSDEVRIDRDAIRAILTKGLSCDSLKSLNDATAAAGSDGECGGTSSNVSSISTTSTNYNNYNNNNNNTINKPTSLSTSSTKKFPETGNEMINARVKHMQRQKSRRNLVTGGRQRTDLGTFGNTRPDLGTVANTTNNNKMNEEKTQPMGFVGTISSLLFGRKGGLL